MVERLTVNQSTEVRFFHSPPNALVVYRLIIPRCQRGEEGSTPSYRTKKMRHYGQKPIERCRLKSALVTP